MSRGFFSSLQREVLRAELSTDAYPDYERVAEMVGDSKKRVMKWFEWQRREQGLVKKKRPPGKKFTAAQVTFLRREADKGDRPDAARIARIAKRLGETNKRIHQWFGDERRRRGTRKKDPRKRFSKSVVVLLRREADKGDRPDAARIARIAKQLKETNKRIYDWFSNERKRRGTAKKGKPSKRFTSLQVQQLRDVLNSNPYPNYARLALDVGDTKKRVWRWFADNRYKYGIFIDEKGQVSIRRDAASDDDDDDKGSDDEFDDLEDDWLPLLCRLSGEQQEVAQRLAHAMPYLRQGRYKRFLRGRLGVPRSERWRLLLVCWWAGTRDLLDSVAEARHYQGPRCPFSLQQLRGLSDLYARNANPSIAVRRVAGARLGLTEHQIYSWCYYRRKKGGKLPSLPETQADEMKKQFSKPKSQQGVTEEALLALRQEHVRVSRLLFRLSLEPHDEMPKLDASLPLLQNGVNRQASRRLATDHAPTLASLFACLPEPSPELSDARRDYVARTLRRNRLVFHDAHLQTTYASVLRWQARFVRQLAAVHSGLAGE